MGEEQKIAELCGGDTGARDIHGLLKFGTFLLLCFHHSMPNHLYVWGTIYWKVTVFETSSVPVSLRPQSAIEKVTIRGGGGKTVFKGTPSIKQLIHCCNV